MDRGTLLPVVLVTVAALVGTAMAQTAPPPAAQGETGFTSYAEFGGSSNSDGQVYELDSSVGYNFSQHFGMDVGVPVYFVHASSSTTGGSTSDHGLGKPHVGLALEVNHSCVN